LVLIRKSKKDSKSQNDTQFIAKKVKKTEKISNITDFFGVWLLYISIRNFKALMKTNESKGRDSSLGLRRKVVVCQDEFRKNLIPLY